MNILIPSLGEYTVKKSKYYNGLPRLDMYCGDRHLYELTTDELFRIPSHHVVVRQGPHHKAFLALQQYRIIDLRPLYENVELPVGMCNVHRLLI